MGYITLGVLGFTAMCLFFGALLGLIRGRNRSILRLILVVLSAVVSLKYKDKVVDAVMNYEYQGKNVKALLSELLSSGEVAIPESIQNILFVLVEIIVSIVAFFVLFFILKFITWLIVFPILKIIVRRGKRRHTLAGGFFGLVQGAVVAFVICAPLTGLLIQTDQISQIKIQDEYILAIPEEIGVAEYVNSEPAKIYTSVGAWFFDLLSSKTDENGKKISIDDTCDVVTTVAGIADTFSSISKDLSNITSGNITVQEQVDTIKKVGDSLISIGNSVNSLNEDSKAMVQDLIDGVKEMVAGESGEIPPEVENALNSLDINNLKLDSAGEAINGIATYIEKTSDEFENSEPVTQEDVNKIVSGLADNTFIIDMVVGENEVPEIVKIDEENKEKFENAINESTLTEEDKETLRKLFGLFGEN